MGLRRVLDCAWLGTDCPWNSARLPVTGWRQAVEVVSMLPVVCHNVDMGTGDGKKVRSSCWLKGKADLLAWDVRSCPQVSPTQAVQVNPWINSKIYWRQSLRLNFLPWHLFSPFISLWTCNGSFPVFGVHWHKHE